jgi:23S rRNA pseudouridine2605 synthase
MGETDRTGDRIAKVIARAGRASRREAEQMIAEGRVSVNGKRIDSPALNVAESDRIAVDGVALEMPEAPRLWLYHKPAGLVTTTKDEKGRPTVFEKLPPEMPRVVSVGRLDLNSEGLLLLTNDGGIKRKLELPSTGWVRKYRVRVNGSPADADLAPLRAGITVEGERFQPMAVTLDRQQGANAWLTIGIREGRNREIRRALGAIGLTVNRLIRISYGPFQLGELAPGAVEEVRPKVVRDQLGLGPAKGETGSAPARGDGKPARPAGRKAPARPTAPGKVLRTRAPSPEDRPARAPAKGSRAAEGPARAVARDTGPDSGRGAGRPTAGMAPRGKAGAASGPGRTGEAPGTRSGGKPVAKGGARPARGPKPGTGPTPPGRGGPGAGGGRKPQRPRDRKP